MIKIFLDFEMNRVSKDFPEVKKKCGFEIIQIGAVMLDEDNREISGFNEFVHPDYSSAMDSKIEN